ncbi:MAG: DUF488 domain-containing protein [Terriglobales bacterium]
MPVTVKRVYEKRTASDGTRVLVERLWPRGLTKAEAGVHLWLKDLAPSTALRKWFHARPSMWLAFRQRYLEELSAPAAAKALAELYELVATRKPVTLVYAARDKQHNGAVILKELLEGMRKPPHSTGPKGGAAAQAGAARAKR